MNDQAILGDHKSPIFPETPIVYIRSKKRGRIVSLWDMLQLESQSFLAGLAYLSGSVGELKFMLQVATTVAPLAPTDSMEMRAWTLKSIQNLQAACEQHDMSFAAKTAKRTFNTCAEILHQPDRMSPRNIQRRITAIEGLINAVINEAESRKFYMLAGDVKEDHDDADTLFGADVIDAFPNAAFDIVEAGKCISFGLWTASVMHTMRVFEIGLTALATHLSIPSSENWNKTLNDIEAGLRKISKKTDGPDAEQWAAEAGTHLRFVKNAWRNQAMHHVSKYDEQEAKAIFANAKAFMQHLVEQLSEKR